MQERKEGKKEEGRNRCARKTEQKKRDALCTSEKKKETGAKTHPFI